MPSSIDFPCHGCCSFHRCCCYCSLIRLKAIYIMFLFFFCSVTYHGRQFAFLLLLVSACFSNLFRWHANFYFIMWCKLLIIIIVWLAKFLLIKIIFFGRKFLFHFDLSCRHFFEYNIWRWIKKFFQKHSKVSLKRISGTFFSNKLSNSLLWIEC